MPQLFWRSSMLEEKVTERGEWQKDGEVVPVVT